MSITTFDTLKFVKQLKSAGFTDEQAEAQANAIREAFSEALDTQVATKADMAEVKAHLAAHDKLLWGIFLISIGLLIKSFLG